MTNCEKLNDRTKRNFLTNSISYRLRFGDWRFKKIIFYLGLLFCDCHLSFGITVGCWS